MTNKKRKQVSGIIRRPSRHHDSRLSNAEIRKRIDKYHEMFEERDASAPYLTNVLTDEEKHQFIIDFIENELFSSRTRRSKVRIIDATKPNDQESKEDEYDFSNNPFSGTIFEKDYEKRMKEMNEACEKMKSIVKRHQELKAKVEESKNDDDLSSWKSIRRH